jgi:hypothetical protein
VRSLEHRQRGTGPGPLSMCPDPQLGPDGRPPIQPPKLDAESAEVHSHSARHPDPCQLDLGRVDSGHEEASFHLGRGARGRRGHRSTKTTTKRPAQDLRALPRRRAPRPAPATSKHAASTSLARCPTRTPSSRPAASTISESFTLASRGRHHGRSIPGRARSPGSPAPILRADAS